MILYSAYGRAVHFHYFIIRLAAFQAIMAQLPQKAA